jgi:anaerobic selenocysteine-containing dehydrogenase
MNRRKFVKFLGIGVLGTVATSLPTTLGSTPAAEDTAVSTDNQSPKERVVFFIHSGCGTGDPNGFTIDRKMVSTIDDLISIQKEYMNDSKFKFLCNLNALVREWAKVA